MKYFIIFFTIILSVSIIQVHAIPVFHTIEDLEKLSKYNLRGRIVDIKPMILDGNSIVLNNQSKSVAEISINVENESQIQYINDTIKFRVRSYMSIGPPSKSTENSTTFQVGEIVSVFLTGKKLDSGFANSYEGFIASKYVVSDGFAYDVVHIKQESPLKQLKSGIHSKSVNCNEGLELLIKVSNGQPICVTPSTKAKLIERGWATP